MATDVVTIWNLALSAVGERSAVSDEDEPGLPANLCRLWYPVVRDGILKAASWPCATAFARLGLLAERDVSADWTSVDPAPGFKYAYSQPDGMLAPRYLTDYSRFTRGQWGTKIAIFCSAEDAVLCFTKSQPDVTRWDAGLKMAIIYGLAAHIAKPLSGKENNARAMAEKANELILLARTDFANESDEVYESLPSWVQARGYDGPTPFQQRYVWPVENFSGMLA